MYMTYLTISEARAILPEVLDRVERGEEIVITRHGRPSAVLLRPDAVRARRAEQTIDRAREVATLLAEARARPLSGPALTTDRAQELVEAIDADRGR